MSKKDDGFYLEMIVDHLDAIVKYTPATEAEFNQDQLRQDGILLRLQALGEAMNQVSGQFREEHPDWPWLQAVALRHVISHDYYSVSLATIWELLSGDELSKLREKVQQLIK